MSVLLPLGISYFVVGIILFGLFRWAKVAPWSVFVVPVVLLIGLSLGAGYGLSELADNGKSHLGRLPTYLVGCGSGAAGFLGFQVLAKNPRLRQLMRKYPRLRQYIR